MNGEVLVLIAIEQVFLRRLITIVFLFNQRWYAE